MILLLFLTLHIPFLIAKESFSSPYYYYCDNGYCKKAEITENVKKPLALSVCQLFCGEMGSIWPKPTGHVTLSNFTVELDPNSISLRGIDLQSNVGQLLEENVNRLKQNIKRLSISDRVSKGYGLIITVSGQFDVESAKLLLNTPENYTLKIGFNEKNQIIADINSKSYFGIRHGIETLSQLIVYDDLYNIFKIIGEANISDGPAFPYRGVCLDTSRNYIDKQSILRTIEAMGMSKLNTFHWHISDSQSFPFVSRTFPQMSKYGAYAPNKVYSEDDIKEIIRFGLVMGVRIIPELDTPAHVGEGWQWVGENITTCFKAKPYVAYCAEPPCGQLNPTNEIVYEILKGLYTDMLHDFDPELFHMGGDEINFRCWKSSAAIKDWMAAKGLELTDENFYKLWKYFQSKAYEKLSEANGGKEIKAILWTSDLANEENIHFLDPKKYVFQIWTKKTDTMITRLLKNNFEVIFSNYDALYFDCGFGAWMGTGNNWCSPYIGWQKVYDNSPLKIVKQLGLNEEKYKHLILGSEAALWSEQVDSAAIDSRLWPRAAAMAERVWSDPSTNWSKAEQRILRYRERLVERNILADSLEPEWCRQNQDECTKKLISS